MGRLTAIFFLCFLFSGQTILAAAGGGSGSGGMRGGGNSSSQRIKAAKTPKQIGVSNYQKGIKYRDRAMKLEEKAAAETKEKKKLKLQKKAEKQYKKAIKKYKIAIKKLPAFYQAHSSLGYALRKTEDIESSLIAYDNSIKINLVYPEAIEYRAETHLQLGRFEDVKEAYMELFSDYPREYADQLMQAMDEWHQQNQQTSTETATEFVSWFKQRQEISNNTLSMSQPQSSWDSEI